jgi:hypothetical protein
MADEKDRLGDKLHQKEKAEEDRYFKEQEKAAIERLRQRGAKGEPGAPAAKLDCPKDGTPLLAIDHHGVLVEECPTCHGMWLDAGELQTVASRERDSWLGRLFYRPRR